MKLNPYLTFEDSGAEALAFYAKALGGKVVTIMKYGDLPEADWVTDDIKERMAHGRVDLGEFSIMASDAMPNNPFEGYKGVTLQTAWHTVDEARAAFDALSAGGTIEMALQETFWAHAFGTLRDKYGVHWMVNVDKTE